MGLLDSVLGAVGGAMGGAMGGSAGGNAGAQGGGGQAALISLVLGMLANQGQGAQAGAQGGGLGGAFSGLGGLGGLIGKFQQGGLGEVVSSWVGTGQNLPVSAEQLKSVLGSDMVAQIAQHLGVSHDAAAGQLSQVLPEVVDKLTPHGVVPEAGTADGGLGGIGDILARFGQR